MAKAKKLCPECNVEVWDLDAHQVAKHGADLVEPENPGAGLHGEPVHDTDVAPAVLERPAVDETPPRKPRLMDRFRSRRGRGRDGGPRASVPGERPPKRKTRSGRRVPLDADISDIWAFGGRRLENTVHYPTGRMLQYQAPAAGIILDRAFAGSLPDRILFQPLARNRDKYEDVGFLIAGPILTASITMTQQQMQAAIESGDKETFDALVGKLEMQREMFTWILSMMLPRLAKGAALAREKKAKRDADIAEAFPELGDQDPVDVLASMLFEPPTFEEASTNGKPDTAPASPVGENTVPFGS